MQKYNAEMVELLSAHFPLRKDASFAWGNAVGGFLMTPQLRGFWPGSSQDQAASVYDLSGQGRTLTAPVFIWGHYSGLAPILYFDAALSQYLTRVTEPGLELTAYLTTWAWIKLHTESMGITKGIISKWNAAAPNQCSFALYKTAADLFSFAISANGAVITSDVPSTGWAAEVNKWYFIAGKYQFSTINELFMGEATSGKYRLWTDIVGIPASLHNSTDNFEVGRVDHANYLDGELSQIGLASFPVQDFHLFNMFSQTRPLFI